MPSRRHSRHFASRYRAMAAPYTRRRFGGRQPSCGIGVTSRIAVISRPAACSERIAASRPAPGPRTKTSICFRPYSIALRAASSEAVCAAKGVLLREPLDPALPALDQEDRKSTRLNSSHGYISYAVFCLKKKKKTQNNHTIQQKKTLKNTK